jgi:hypothetical protein
LVTNFKTFFAPIPMIKLSKMQNEIITKRRKTPKCYEILTQ